MPLRLARWLCLASLLACTGRARADAALDEAVRRIAAGARFDALVENGHVRVGRGQEGPLAQLVTAPPAALTALVAHPSPVVRVAVATAIVTSRPELLAALAPLRADVTKVERQSFDVFFAEPVAEVVAALVCQRVDTPRFVEELLAIARDEHAAAIARARAIECLRPVRREASETLAQKALSRTGDSLAAGAIRVILTGWLERQGLAPYALHNSQEPIKITWRPSEDELRPVARQATSPERDVRELVGEAIAWVDAPGLRDTVRALATDADHGVRMLTLRSYMQRPSLEPDVIAGCLADEDAVIADGCARVLPLVPDHARWLAWALAERPHAPARAQPIYAQLIRALKRKARKP